MNSQVNTLTLQYYDNIHRSISASENLLVNGGYQFRHEQQERYTYNFVAFYIDNQRLCERFWVDAEAEFLDSFVGLLGCIDRYFDELIIKYMLKEKITAETIRQLLLQYRKPIRERQVELLVEAFTQNVLLIYGCRVCRDLGCGGIRLQVSRDQDYYYWELTKDLRFKFGRLAYEKEWKAYRQKVRTNNFEQTFRTELYRMD